MIFKKDNLRLGLFLGLIGPLIGLTVIYFISFSSFSFLEYLDYFMHDNKVITRVGTFSLLANAFLFAIYVHFDKSETFKGIFIMTLIYGIGILVLKII
jgi:ABC-type antimicrobial peptide transport system permease subunit